MRAASFVVLIVALAAFVAIQAPACAAEVGQAPPRIKVSEWIKGPLVSLADLKGERPAVIGFWRGSGRGARDRLEALSDLHDRFRHKALAVIALTSDTPAAAKAFVGRCDNVTCRVALVRDAATVDAFRMPKGHLPDVAVIGRDGRLVWRGILITWADPLVDRHLTIVSQVAAGRFDPALEARKEDLAQQILRLGFEKDTRKTRELLDRLAALDKTDPAPYWKRFDMLLAEDRDTDAARVLKDMETVFANDPAVLHELVLRGVGRQAAPRRTDRLLALARRTASLTEEKSVTYLETLARLEHANGNIRKAVSAQERATALSAGSGKRIASRVLEYYRVLDKSPTAPAVSLDNAFSVEFPALVRAAKTDPKFNQFGALRLAYAKTPQYAPYGWDDDPPLPPVTSGPAGPKERQRRSVEAMLDRSYANIKVHLRASRAYEQLGEKGKAKYHSEFARRLLGSIFESGDGRGADTAYVVIGVYEESILLASLGLGPSKQTLLKGRGGRYYDRIGPAGHAIYFDVTLPFKTL